MRVGVVGAGISGLVCARRLQELVGRVEGSVKLQLSVLEWGRGPGGRTARRRIRVPTADGSGESIEVSFDHASPYFGARTSEFKDGLLATWQASGWANPWAVAASREEAEQGVETWVGVPSNHAIARSLASEIQTCGAAMHYGTHVKEAKCDDGVWQVTTSRRDTAEEQILSFDALVLSDKLLVLPNRHYPDLLPDPRPPTNLNRSTGILCFIRRSGGRSWRRSPVGSAHGVP